MLGVSSTMAIATAWTRRLSICIAVGGLAILMGFALLTTVDGLLRTIVGRPLDIVRDAGELVVAICGTSTLAITVLERGNITIKFLEAHLSRRSALYLDLCVSVLCTAILVAMAWQFILYSRSMSAAGEVTFVFSLPKAPFWYVVSALVWIASLAQAVLALQSVADIAETHGRPNEDVVSS